MKRMWWIALLAALLATLLFCGAPASAEEADGEPDEWTVLFYFCGSDLESKYGYAAGNLEEIGETNYPSSYLPVSYEEAGVEADPDDFPTPGKVNVLIETGGSRQWHTEECDWLLLPGLEMNVSADAVQRWRYSVYPFGGQDTDGPYDGFELMQSLPLQSMGDPATLSDFIRWGVETCPAKKYALVLWDHGGGAKTGLFIDELFDGDVMYLHELRQALADGGARFETVIIDACLMANIETAWAIKDSANWMVASEEVVPGKGTAVGDWLQALYAHSGCDGRWLSRCVCDMTQIKYANEDDDLAKSLTTWSVIDLSKMDALVEAADELFGEIGACLTRYPDMVGQYVNYILSAEAYGDSQQGMRDLGGVVYNTDTIANMRPRVRENLLDALEDAVVYAVRGPGRSGARGLSFCYAANATPEELEIYAQCCPSARYLAFLDAVSQWTAPDWVYEAAERLPEVDAIEALQLTPIRETAADGMPGFRFGDSQFNVRKVYYRMYRLDEETGEVLRLGRTDCIIESTEDFDTLWRAGDPMHWPAVDGVLCCIDLLQEEMGKRLYNIPVQIGSEMCVLRCGREITYETPDDEDAADIRKSEYEVYGVWAGYDDHSAVLSRSVKPLAMLAGQEYQLLYPTDAEGEGGRTMYWPSETLTMYRALDVEEIPLPPGVYYIEYEVVDLLDRSFVLDRIEARWDGENLTFPDGWEGEAALVRD